MGCCPLLLVYTVNRYEPSLELPVSYRRNKTRDSIRQAVQLVHACCQDRYTLAFLKTSVFVHHRLALFSLQLFSKVTIYGYHLFATVPCHLWCSCFLKKRKKPNGRVRGRKNWFTCRCRVTWSILGLSPVARINSFTSHSNIHGTNTRASTPDLAKYICLYLLRYACCSRPTAEQCLCAVMYSMIRIYVSHTIPSSPLHDHMTSDSYTEWSTLDPVSGLFIYWLHCL